MILSRKFVSDYIDLDSDLSIDTIAQDMTSVGNEYDYCGKFVNASNLIIGEVIECEEHPDSDHLHLCRVNIGSEVLNIVCGAPNVRVGIKVVVALDGAVLPGGVIKKGVIRGCESNGMLCSIKELGLDNKFLTEKDIDGIAELGNDAVVGSDPLEYLGLDDEIIDFELTANRGDELSVLGLAYELGAIYSKRVKDIELGYKVDFSEKINDSFSISVKTDGCSLFLAKKVKNVVIGDSPKFIKSRLMACGIRPINNVVDISNYVMLETGQPLHFYDADCLGDTLIVRNANDGEVLTTLDGVSRELDINDLVIANNDGVVGLAGVMGGLTTEVVGKTKDIIIESAIFDSVMVRKTSKKFIRSEASNRFEKGLDPKRTYMAIERACSLLEKYASGVVIDGRLEYDVTKNSEREIGISISEINNVLGTELDISLVKSIFERLGFDVSNKEEDTIIVNVPSRRGDISIKEDLIEEVGRIYGINNIKGKLPRLDVKRGSYDVTTRSIRNKLVDLGLNEVLTQIFIPLEEGHSYTNDSFETVKLMDPLSVQKNAIRYSMIPSLMRVYDYNKARGLSDVMIFEMAKGFYLKDGNYGEDYKLCMLLTGNYYLELGNNKKIDFYITKGIVCELLHFLGYDNRYSFVVDDLPSEFHPGQSASIVVAGSKIGIMGKLHPNTCLEDVFVVEINLSKLLSFKTGRIKYKEVNKYPSIKKDFAVILDNNIISGDVVKTIKQVGGKLLSDVSIFDLYVGNNIGVGKKSIGFSLVFSDYSKTLTDSVVNEIFNDIIEKVVAKYKAVLRDN